MPVFLSLSGAEDPIPLNITGTANPLSKSVSYMMIK